MTDILSNMHYSKIQFSWFQNGITTIKPSGLISLEQFVNAVRSPKPEMVEAFKLIEIAGKTGNKVEKDRLKTEKLFFTTPSTIVDPIRNYDSIKSFTPFCVLEYDDVEYAEELRDYIFEKFLSCIFACVSPSKTGAKFIFYIDTPTSIVHYKELFFGLASELDKFKGLDLSNERCTQPLFNSYDPNAKYREDAIQSFKRGYKTNAFVPPDIDMEIPETCTEEEKEKCLNLVSYLIDRIEDSGHNQVISTSFLAGGLSAYYGISELWDTLEEKINENNYLAKGLKGYLTSARTMYNKGLVNPKALKQNSDG